MRTSHGFHASATALVFAILAAALAPSQPADAQGAARTVACRI